ncbi:MAG: hypothetical protein FJW37_08715 [Acidobacteria bacterium]|nr:hypothetical protein [Acidobacteriota bacterium]
MKRRALLALAAASLAAAQSEKPKQLSSDELAKMLEEKQVFFLDVREPRELEELGTIAGYKNIPLNQLESRLAEIPKDKLIVTA